VLKSSKSGQRSRAHDQCWFRPTFKLFDDIPHALRHLPSQGSPSRPRPYATLGLPYFGVFLFDQRGAMFNNLLLISCICIVVALILYFFYWNRFIAFLIKAVIRVIYGNQEASSSWVEIGKSAPFTAYTSAAPEELMWQGPSTSRS
jgi:hypothetical protein